MQIEKVQAFVLSSSDYGESDRIASLFTLDHGRLKGFARGARNSRKRFGPALEPFARIDLQLNVKEGLSSLRGADVITIYPGVRGELGAIANALYACEVVENLTPEGQPLPRLYRLLAAYLEHLDSGQGSDGDRRFFEVNMLNILGYRPSLEGCSRCGAGYDESGAFLQQGGELVCHLCAANGRRMSPASLRWLDSCLATGRFGYVKPDDAALRLAGHLLDESLAAHSARMFKSLEFLRQSADSSCS